jgi:uncharacterized protein
MKLQPDSIQGPVINAYGEGWVEINGIKVVSSVVLSARGPQFAWNVENFDDLNASHFEQLAPLEAEMVLFGSGKRIRFPQPQWLQALHALRIGVETMDTQAACRTYNFLASEGRHVVVALLL